MSNVETINIEAHKAAIEELYYLDRSTQEFQLKISNFLLKHPELAGTTYTSAEIIMKEKDPYVRAAAIGAIAAEIKRRKDVDAPGYRITYARMTTNQVQRILNKEKQKRNPIRTEVKVQKRTVHLKCSHCKKVESFEEVKLDKVVAFRTTEAMDDAIEYLSTQCSVSRSFLIAQLLKIERKYGKRL